MKIKPHDYERPNRAPKAERLGEEIPDDAAPGGGMFDGDFETKIDADGDEAGDEADAGPRARRL